MSAHSRTGTPLIPRLFCRRTLESRVYKLATNFCPWRSEEHTSELQSLTNLVCRLLLEKKKKEHGRWNVRVVDEKARTEAGIVDQEIWHWHDEAAESEGHVKAIDLVTYVGEDQRRAVR